MAKDPANKSREAQNGIPKSTHRGNMDEYEAVRTIVSENPGLLMRVLDKIRSARDGQGAVKTSASNKGGENDQKKK